MAQAAALILLVLGLLPIANWIPGGHDAPWYSQRLTEWISGTTIVVGAGVLAVVALRSWPGLWRRGLWAGVAARWRAGDRRADVAIAAAALVLCAAVARLVFSARPLFIDEITQLFQARIFATGHLFLRAPTFPEFTSTVQLLDWNGKVYGQFPAGGPAMLALGVLLHSAWLVGPVASALGVYCFGRLLRYMPLGDGTALAALLLYALAPFAVFLGGTMMNAVTETAWLLAAALAVMIATADAAPRAGAAFLAGLALGIAASIRPADAAAFALPTAAWLLWRARDGMPHVRVLLWSAAGVAIPLALLFWVNTQQTGHALRFGYVEMWGASHELGFHAAPWGDAHTPARGLELINIYFLRLQDYLFESAAPSLLFATLALALAPRLRGFDRWILSWLVPARCRLLRVLAQRLLPWSAFHAAACTVARAVECALAGDAGGARRPGLGGAGSGRRRHRCLAAGRGDVDTHPRGAVHEQPAFAANGCRCRCQVAGRP